MHVGGWDDGTGGVLLGRKEGGRWYENYRIVGNFGEVFNLANW